MEFELLPDLVLGRVFSFFDSVEKLQLQLVCRRWRVFLRSKILLVHEPEARGSMKWLDLVGSVDGQNFCAITFDKETQRLLPVDSQMLENKQLDQIKKLLAFGMNGFSILLSQLVHLRQLEILKMDNCVNHRALRGEYKIELPKLCVLVIKNTFLFHSAVAFFRIRAPN